MSSIKARGYFRNGILIWELRGNQLEFTVDEFREIIDGIRGMGLIPFLDRERPALRDQLLCIFKDFQEDEGGEELQYLLEQSLLEIFDSLLD